ncbi:MAG TPA: response regulator [Caldimonas sp.]|nr:response regulator [Caldimonas sp.]HEX2539973.1 response regulator [Caldimonas sp.]
MAERSERVLVFAPAGRDAQVAQSVLAAWGAKTSACGSVAELLAEITRGAGAVVLTDEAIAESNVTPLTTWLREQPPWADLPFIVLTRQGGSIDRNPAAERLTSALANVSLLERPFHATTLVSLVRSALRARRRQYMARDALDAAHESEAKLRIAMEAGRLGAWEIALPARTLVASAQCRADFGRGADEPFAYADLLASLHAEDRAQMERLLDDPQRIASAVVYRCTWPDGSVHAVEMKGRLRLDLRGQPAAVAGVSLDVTERLRAEVERDRLLAELSQERGALEQRVAARTADLAAANEILKREVEAKHRAEDQLRQSQKLETMGQLVGGVAHDFNNLLMVILSSLELLRRRSGDDALTLRLLDSARRGAERGSVLTKRLLAFARKQDLEPERIDLVELATGMADLLQRSVGPQIEIEIHPESDVPAVVVDRIQLEMAVLNLVVNARDALAGSGRIALVIRRERDIAAADAPLAPGNYASISVEDSGPGMDAETLRQAVEPFFSTKGVGQGTGLGLSMVHGMARQSGGAFVHRSRPGDGTRASIWLPAAENLGAAAPTPTAMPVVARARTGTILMVDDDELVAASTAAMLEDLGYAVVTRHSAKDALEVLSNGTVPDLLITDHAMPVMTGVELAALVRRLRPDLPILLATGFAELSGTDLHGLAKLTKPFSQAELARELSRLLVVA